ncbi:efflux RND transporter periplasmic adaptor subunit [Vallitalea okinawensis]|uniref:efflux RND transporter periplasmic adaptor subunit n=1 Tax=Vallitalea okinawensis TaxID=2078660 RepID=UPI000CFE1F21|nr:HlyD family efflux transporter periplasmic adaptor subunit [Vallitalea okinawensis]
MEKKIKKFIIYFVVTMIFLAFISKTLSNATIPVITYSTTQSDEITPEISCYGQVITEDYEELTYEVPVKIKEILYSEGKRLPKSQAMMLLDMDYMEEQIKKFEMNQQKLEANLAKYNKLIGEQSDYTATQRQVYLLESEIESLQEDVAYTQKLYETGATSLEEYEKILDQLSMKETELEWTNEDLNIQRQQDAEQKESYVLEKLSLEAELELLKLEKSKYEEMNEEVSMPYTCFIKDIKVNEGDLVPAYTPVVKVLNRDANMIFEALFPVDKEGEIHRGKKVTVLLGDTVAKGRIEYIYSNDDGINVVLGIILEEGSNAYIGQRGKVNMRFSTRPSSAWVPVEAIREDGGGEYVFVLEERKSIIGEKYVVEKRRVVTGDRSHLIVGITDGLFAGEKIVNTSSKPLEDGCDVYVQE